MYVRMYVCRYVCTHIYTYLQKPPMHSHSLTDRRASKQNPNCWYTQQQDVSIQRSLSSCEGVEKPFGMKCSSFEYYQKLCFFLLINLLSVFLLSHHLHTYHLPHPLTYLPTTHLHLPTDRTHTYFNLPSISAGSPGRIFVTNTPGSSTMWWLSTPPEMLKPSPLLPYRSVRSPPNV